MVDGGGCRDPKRDHSGYKFQTYRSTKLYYEMLCEPISSGNEVKDGDNISSNCLANLKQLTTNIEKF